MYVRMYLDWAAGRLGGRSLGTGARAGGLSGTVARRPPGPAPPVVVAAQGPGPVLPRGPVSRVQGTPGGGTHYMVEVDGVVIALPVQARVTGNVYKI